MSETAFRPGFPSDGAVTILDLKMGRSAAKLSVYCTRVFQVTD